MVGADDVEYRLMSDLLRNYDRRVRPSLNSSEPLNVTFGLALAQIIDVVRVHMFIRVSNCTLVCLSVCPSLYVAVAPSGCLTNHPSEISIIWLEASNARSLSWLHQHKQSIRLAVQSVRFFSYSLMSFHIAAS